MHQIMEPVETPSSLGLTRNQYELLHLYAHGLSVKEIAIRQSRGLATIYQSLVRIKERLGIERDADLIAFAIEHGLRAKPLPPAKLSSLPERSTK